MLCKLQSNRGLTTETFMRIYTTAIAIMSTIAAAESSEMPFKKMTEIMQVKKLSEFAVIPTRGSLYAAGNICLFICSIPLPCFQKQGARRCRLTGGRFLPRGGHRINFFNYGVITTITLIVWIWICLTFCAISSMKFSSCKIWNDLTVDRRNIDHKQIAQHPPYQSLSLSL